MTWPKNTIHQSSNFRQNGSKLIDQPEPLLQTPPPHCPEQERLPMIYDEERDFAVLKKADGLAKRVRLKQAVCARKIRVILIDDLSYFSPGCIPEDYLLWFDLCAAHGVKLATPDRVFDPGQHNDWVQLLVQAGFDPEDIDDLNRESREKRRERSLRKKKPLTENPPSPYVYMASLGVLSVDFEQLQQMQELWTLAETHSIPVVAEKVGLPVSIVRRAISVERLLFYQGLWLDPENGELRKGQWPAVMSAEQAGHILVNRQPESS